jgi:o-succinylbenzoate synthase
MRIVDLEITPRAGAIASVANARQAWTERIGFHLRLIDAEGRVGEGEASPLPGYSHDGAFVVGSGLENLRALLPWNVGADWFARIVELPPSAAFACETATLDLLAQERGQPLYRLLDPAASPSTVPLSALVGSVDDADRAWTRGIRTLKVKVGKSGGWAEELALLASLRRRFGGALRLRLDANGVWTANEVDARLAELVPFAPELIEEPAADPTQVVGSPIPLALDESLQVRDLEEFKAWLPKGPCRALVLKPMALGGFARCLALAERSAELGLRVAVSHLFDGPIALAAAAHLALAINAQTPLLACGLDGHPGLAAWPQADLPWIGDAAIEAPTLPGLGMRWRAP